MFVDMSIVLSIFLYIFLLIYLVMPFDGTSGMVSATQMLAKHDNARPLRGDLSINYGE